MGLGPADARFQEIDEEDMLGLQNQNEVVNIDIADEDSDDEALFLMEGINNENMGQQQ